MLKNSIETVPVNTSMGPRPFEDLLTMSEAADQAGMRSVHATLLDLKDAVTDPEVNDTYFPQIPGHQEHIVTAALNYADLDRNRQEGGLPRSAILYRETRGDEPAPANRVNEVLALVGAGDEVADKKGVNTRTVVWTSRIPGYHVQLTERPTGMEVRAVRRRGAAKRTRR